MSEEVAFPVMTPAAMSQLMRRGCPKGRMPLYTGFASYMGRPLIQKGLFHFLAVSPYSPGSSLLQSGRGVSGPETSAATPLGPKSR